MALRTDGHIESCAFRKLVDTNLWRLRTRQGDGNLSCRNENRI